MRRILSIFVLFALCASVFAASTNFKTYINDYIDKYTEDRVTSPYGLNNFSDTDIKPCFDQTPTLGFLTISSPEIADPSIGCAHGKKTDKTSFSPLEDFAVSTQGGTVTETQTIWAYGSTVYDEVLQNVVSPSPNVAYKIDFGKGQPAGLPQNAGNSVIRFLGANWIVVSMNAPNITGYNPAIHFGYSGNTGSITLLNMETGESLTLSHNQQIANNPTWYPYLYWVPDQYGTPTLRTVVLRRDPSAPSVMLLTLSKGDSIGIISSPNKFQYLYDGINLGASDYDALTMVITGLTTISYGNGDCSVTYPVGPTVFLEVNTGTPNAFNIAGTPVSTFYVDLNGANGSSTSAYYQQAGMSCFFRIPVSPGSTIATYSLGDGTTQTIVLESLWYSPQFQQGNATIGLHEVAVLQGSAVDQFLLTITKMNSTWNFLSPSPEKITYKTAAPLGGGPAGYPNSRLVSTNFVSERGSVFYSYAPTSAYLKVAKRVAEATYSISTVGSICGDATCNGNENCTSCSSDCGTCLPVCGNGRCEAGENCTTCSSDCGVCPPQCTPRTYCSGLKTVASVDATCKVTYTNCGNGPYCCQSGRCIKDVSGKTCRIPAPVAQIEGPDMTPWYVAGIGAVLLLGFAAYFYMSKKKK